MARQQHYPTRQAALLVLAAAALGVAAFIFSRQPDASAPPDQVYFYDLATGKLLAQPADTLPPQTVGDSNSNAVLAHVFACGNCADLAQRQTLMLETLTPEARNYLLNPPVDPQPGIVENGTLIAPTPATPDQAPKWVIKNSDAGINLREQIARHCDGRPPKPCFP